MKLNKKDLEYDHDLITNILKWKDEGNKIFYIKGVFDLLHEGHIAFLEYINRKIRKLYGKNVKLIVAVESDEITKKKKGKNRPYENELIRKQKLIDTGLIDDVLISNYPARFLLKELEILKIDYFILPEEYIKHIKLFYLLKNSLKQKGVKILISRVKQYPKYDISPNLALIRTTNIVEKNLIGKISTKIRHITYLTKELLYFTLRN